MICFIIAFTSTGLTTVVVSIILSQLAATVTVQVMSICGQTGSLQLFKFLRTSLLY